MLIQKVFGSIIYHVDGNRETAKQYEELAMKEYIEHENSIKAMFEGRKHKSKKHRDKCTYRVEENIPKNVRKKLYEMVS